MAKPKKKIRWFRWFLIALVISLPLLYVLFRTSTQSQIDKELEKIRDAGYPASCVELDAWYKQVPPDENGAEVVLEAIDQIVKWEEKDTPFDDAVSADMAQLATAYGITDVEITDTPSGNFPEDWQKKNRELLPLFGISELPGRTARMSEPMKALISDYLADNSKTLEILHKTTKHTKSRYPVDLSTGFTALMPYLSEFRFCAKILSLKAALHCENNQPDKAVESFKAAIAVSKTLADEPILISYLVKIGCDNLAIRNLEYILNHTKLNSEQLEAIGQALDDVTPISNLKRAFVGERCFGINAFNNADTTILSPGSTVPASALKATGLLYKDFLAYLDLMGRQIEALNLPSDQRKKAFQQIESDIIALPWYCYLTKMVIPALGKSVDVHYRYQTIHHLAQTAVAIEQYRLTHDNKLPADLTELVPTYLKEIPTDPFDQTPIKYIKLKKGYTIYSIGEDMTDNGGTELDDDGHQYSEGTDITFVVEK